VRGLALGILAALSFGALVGCGKEPDPVAPRPTATPTLNGSGPAGGVEILDMALRTVKAGGRVGRVVALSATAQGFAEAFGVEVVGKTSDAGGAGQAAVVGSTNRPDFAAVAALKPDLVLADASLQGALRKDFDQFPYPVFMLKVASYDDVLWAFRAVGEAFDRKDKAEELVAETEQRAAAVKASVAGRTAPKALILTGSGRDVYAGSDASYLGSLVKLLGGVNVAGSAPQSAPIAGYGLAGIEQAATLNPDVVLVVGGPQSDLKGKSRVAGWAGTTAAAGAGDRGGRACISGAGEHGGGGGGPAPILILTGV
jgi:ABC-type Fe3+-hydroxamate transport system substrate-binding protein